MQVSLEAIQVVWYSYLLKDFPQFILIHTVKGFGIVNKAEIDAPKSLQMVIAAMKLKDACSLEGKL